MRDLAAVDRQLAELASELPAPNVRALLGRILGSDRSLARLHELLEGFGSAAGAVSPRPPAALRDPLGGAGQRSNSLRAEARLAPRSEAPAASAVLPSAGLPPAMLPPVGLQPAGPMRPNPPGVRGSLPPRIVSPLAPAHGDSLKTATPWPPVASMPAAARSSRDTLVDAAVPPPALALPKVDEVELDAATRALFGITEQPAALSIAPAATAVPLDALLPAEDEPRPEKRRNTLQWGSGIEPLPPPADLITNAIPPASAASAAATAEARENRQSMRALLDQEIDPRDFPSSHPPRARSMPPPLSKQPPPAAVAPDGFEMLIDDEAEDDIIEIDDMELEEIE